MAIGEPEFRGAHPMDLAGAVDGVGGNQHILEFAAVGAGIGLKPAADRPGHAGQKFEPGDPGLSRRKSDVSVECTSTGSHLTDIGLDIEIAGRA